MRNWLSWATIIASSLVQFSDAAKYCPYKWEKYDDSCYVQVYENLNFISAWQKCQSLYPMYNSSLVSIHSKDENDFVVSLATKNREWCWETDFPWIGLSYTRVNNKYKKDGWFWVDGTKFNYKNWKKDEPCNRNFHCALLYSDGKGSGNKNQRKTLGKWANDQCAFQHASSICKMPAQDDPDMFPQYLEAEHQDWFDAKKAKRS